MTDLDNFRRETRAWLEANCPPEMRRPMTSEEDTFWGGRNTKFSSEPQRLWFERMRDKGWTVPHWPKEYGGGNWEAGSGALQFAEARLPQQVMRNEQHLQAMRRVLYSKKFRGRQPGETPLLNLLDFRLDISQGESR